MFFQHRQIPEKKKKISQMYFSTVSLSNHQINSLTEQGQSFNEMNGIFSIYISCIFSVLTCGCCSRLLLMWNRHKNVSSLKYAIKVRKAKSMKRGLRWTEMEVFLLDKGWRTARQLQIMWPKAGKQKTSLVHFSPSLGFLATSWFCFWASFLHLILLWIYCIT